MRIQTVLLAVLVSAVNFTSLDTVCADFDGPYEMQNWSSSGIEGGSTSIDPAAGPTATADFGYEVNLGNPGPGVSLRFADFTTTAAATGVVTFDYTFSGFHAFFLADAQFATLGDSTTIVEDLDTFSNFTVSGSATIEVTQGEPFGFRIGGSNFDSDSRLLGTLTITNFIAPVPGGAVVVAPNSLLVTRGFHVSGDETSLAASDNVDLSIRRLDSDTQSRTEFQIKGISPTATPTSFGFTLEGAVFARSNVVQTIELFDYNAAAWELVSTTDAVRSPAPDSVVTVAATGDLSRFVEAGTMCMEARIHFQSGSPRQRFASNTDQTVWTIGL